MNYKCFTDIVMAVLSCRMPVTCIRAWFCLIHGFKQGKNIRRQPALCITLTRKYQIWKNQNGRLFSCSVNVPLSFHLSILALHVCSLCWLCLSACFWMCLSPFYHFLNVSFSLVWSPSVSYLNRFASLLFFSVSFSPNTSILSLQNLALLSPIPDGLTYITYFTVTL